MPVLKLIHKLAGTVLKGKGTALGGILTTVGLASAGVSGGDPFEAAKKLVELAHEGWPQIVVLVGALTTVAGYFRKAGADAKV